MSRADGQSVARPGTEACLGGYERFLPRLEAYLATIKGYETNRYQLAPEQRALVSRRWGDVIRRYGYEPV